MSRSLLSRSLEPLVAISWGVFLAWSVWLAAVWMFGINHQWLGLPFSVVEGGGGGAYVLLPEAPMPDHADLRRAVLVLANHAELAWFALALIQLHLHVMSVNGLNTGRTWLGITVLGAFLLASVNRTYGFPFGQMGFTEVLGSKFFGVPLGWVLLWSVLLIGSREAMLRFLPKASHLALTTAATGLVVVTMANLFWVSRDIRRAWWYWYKSDARDALATPWYFWVAMAASAWGLLFLLREQRVADSLAVRSIKPVAIMGLLNIAAVLAHLGRSMA